MIVKPGIWERVRSLRSFGVPSSDHWPRLRPARKLAPHAEPNSRNGHDSRQDPKRWTVEMPIAVSRGSLAKETNVHKNTNDRKTKAASATFFTILRICMGRNTGLEDTPLRKVV